MLKIAYIPGDGVGPEVLSQGRAVLDALEKIEWVEYPFSGEHYLRTGVLLPDDALEEMRRLDAIYFGAVGTPKVKPGIIEREILLKMRFGLDLYVNLRPVKVFENVPTPTGKKAEMYFVRENTEDFYVGIAGRHHESAFQLGVITRRGARRIATYAFSLAKKKGKNRVTFVDKANVLSFYHLFREEVAHVAQDYPDISVEYVYVDAMAYYLVNKPESFQIVLTPNMFGDILTDLAAALQGGMGMACSGSINPEEKKGMFEPIHGSAPDIAGKGIANPIAAILSGALMLEFLGREKKAAAIEDAVKRALAQGYKTRDIGGTHSTKEVGEAIVKLLP